ncbi:MAG: hypothetical protein IT454_21875, partial [Planctomycetes bacterium]|nr:hypothetical protein [Planctomycetota bacterium]
MIMILVARRSSLVARRSSLVARRSSLVALARALGAATLAVAVVLAPRAFAQNCNFLRVWVDPAWGQDLAPVESIEQINDPDRPCRTLQFAIDKLFLNLSRSYFSTDESPTWEWQADLQGLVICLPGLYGPHGPYSSGDVLPILMRDRVHVQGLSTQACVLRGGGSNPVSVFWPWTSLCQSFSAEVLLEFTYAHPHSPYPNLAAPTPILATWRDDLPDTREMLDGFSFQGGDAQVVFRTGLGLGTGPLTYREWPLSGKISNCVFDMRHDWTASEQGTTSYNVSGPTFGLMMIKSFLGDQSSTGTTAPCGGVTGYYDQHVVVQNNTFVLGEYGNVGWIHRSRSSAVGVIDVTDPGCAGTACVFVDPNKTFRGLGSNALVNNLFRIPPVEIGVPDSRMAMLGIDAADVTVVAGVPPTVIGDFNGYAPARVGSTNGTFTSIPVAPVVSATGPLGVLLDCATPACAGASWPASPILRIWNGAANPNPPEFDPVFVGELLTTQLQVAGVRDWRVMPGSPVIDLGYYAPTIALANGASFADSGCAELQTFDWDGEGYGNPRLVNGSPDLGFDEF